MGPPVIFAYSRVDAVYLDRGPRKSRDPVRGTIKESFKEQPPARSLQFVVLPPAATVRMSFKKGAIVLPCMR